MKKIYNDLFLVFFSLFVVIACDENNDEIVPMTYTNPVASVTNINPVEGYVGDPFTITGTNFGIRTEHVKVYIGSQEAEIVSCEDKSIVAKVPESATNGNISVEVYKQKVETELGYRVLGKPGVSSVTPSYGFPGAEIVFKGQEFALSDALYMLQFGSEDKAKIVEITNDKEFTAVVPESAVSGIISFAIGTQVIDMTSYPFTVLQHATLDVPKEGEPIPSGFAGSKFAITGTNLVQELLDKSVEGLEPLKVTFSKAGGEPVEAAIDIDNLTDKSIPLTVPASLEAGDYTITVITPFETIGTQLKYTVLPMPIVENVTPLKGYVGSKITISGKYFTNTVSDVEVKFGEMPATEINLEGEDNNIVVTVPAMTEFGEKELSLFVRGAEIEMGDYTIFELLTSPVISSVVTNNGFSQSAVQVGNIITITGTGFQNSNITGATFKGQELENVTVVSATQITAAVSGNCEAGEDIITLHFDGVDADVVSTDKLNMLKVDSEVTSYVLKNYSSPFVASAAAGQEWSDPADWIVNAAAKSNLEFGGLHKGVALAMQMGWGSHNNKEVVDGHIYQPVSLPAGNYKVAVHFNEVNLNGACSAYLVVCKGTQFISIDDVNDSNMDILEHERVNSTGDMDFIFKVPEGLKDVSIGVVASIRTNQRMVKFDSIKLMITE